MNKNDIKILEFHGWDVVCESPFEIEHRESKQSADGIIAMMVLQMLKDGIVSTR